MKTYLVVWFSSNGSKPSVVTEILLGMGFRPIEGAYDYEYQWNHDAKIEEILMFGDKIQLELKTSDVMFKLETF